MIITKDWIMDNQTNKGSWNAKQLNAIGISWPPPKGWIGRSIGMEICDTTKERFEQLAREPAKDKINVQDQERRIKALEHKLSIVLCNLDIVLDD